MNALTAQIKDHGNLTRAESKVLKQLCEGKNAKEIARINYRQVRTIRTHIEHIAVKLDAHSSAEIVARAVAKGMVSISLKTFLLCWLSFGVAANDQIDKRRVNPCRGRCAERSLTRTRLDS